MEPQEGICRLCLKKCDKFKAIEGDMQIALDILLPKTDIASIQKPVVCTNCAKMLIKCYDFKTACFCTRDYIIPLVNNNDSVKLNLKDVYQSKNGNVSGSREDHYICGFCINPVKKYSAVSVDVEQGDVILKNMIEKCLPELDLCIIEKPVICPPCHGSLENCFHFVTNCLIVEEKVKEYRETLNVNSNNLIELSELLQFTMRDITTSEVDGSSNDAIKAEEIENAGKREILKGTFKLKQMLCEDDENVKEEVENKSYMELDDLIFKNEEQFTSDDVLTCKEEKQFCEEMENSGKREVVFKLEQIFPEDDEIAKEEVKHKNNMDVDDLIFKNEAQFTPEDVLACKEECNNFDAIKAEETFCGQKEPKEENLAKMEDQKLLLIEEIEIKTEEPDFDRFVDGIVLRQSEITKNPSEVAMYKCDSCPYGTKRKSDFTKHLLVHKSLSEVTVYSCDSCSYQTKYRGGLKKHLLVHKNPKMYKCDSCSFQTKRKNNLAMHLLIHKSPSEVTVYKCNLCSFQAKWKGGLSKHLLVHKRPSKMYKCDSCTFHTKHKGDLTKHLLVHKSPSEITMYKCDSCSFQSKRKRVLVRHLLVHKSPSEVTMYKCDSCSFEAKWKADLTKHLLVHKSPSEITMHKCDSCSFQAKWKGDLTKHLLVHKSPSEITMHKCDSCTFQTKRKGYLTIHLLVHKNPSEVTMHKCDSCSFQTKLKSNHTRHLLVHKSPSEITRYKCDSCSFQSKRKDVLAKHLLIHKSPSDKMKR